LLSIFSIGTGIGAILCEWLSRRRVEIGLVPFGSIGMTVFGADAYFAFPLATGFSDLGIAQFLALPNAWRLLIDVGLMAVFSGLFIVPLFALIQSRTAPDERAQVIAANNILNALFMVVATGFMVLMLDVLGCSIPQLFLATAVLNAVVAIYIYTLVPEFLLRFLTWILINTLYRVQVSGLERVPDDGPALLVCNHVSYVDALVIGGTIPRPTVFVMYYKIFNVPVMRSLFRSARAIPIAGVKEDPVLLDRAWESISAALRAGEVVCIFPEGRLTADGEIAAFRNGVERILERDPVPVIPMALRGLWGSVFSRSNKAMGIAKLPRRFWSKVGLSIGTPQAPESASAQSLELLVRELRGDLA
jgi:1-acyl-sn-glycerol-3-phosphate acyltransferase